MWCGDQTIRLGLGGPGSHSTIKPTGPVIVSHPNLPHRVVMMIKCGKRTMYAVLNSWKESQDKSVLTVDEKKSHTLVLLGKVFILYIFLKKTLMVQIVLLVFITAPLIYVAVCRGNNRIGPYSTKGFQRKIIEGEEGDEWKGESAICSLSCSS